VDSDRRYPPIGDYAFIGDCHSSALISQDASIDWCCMPRFDSGSVFGRLLDWDKGGHCVIVPFEEQHQRSRTYVEGTLVLATTFRCSSGEAVLYDFFAMRRGGRQRPYRELIRIVEGVRGNIEFAVHVSPRFDYGEVKPWLRHDGPRLFTAFGGNDALIFSGDLDFERNDNHELHASFAVRGGERARLVMTSVEPEAVDSRAAKVPTAEETDQRLDETIDWWRRWSEKGQLNSTDGVGAIRSAIVLKAMTNAPTGAVIAAPTASLPESLGGVRNWDYRYSWIRDSDFTVRSLAELGYVAEADGFRRFIQRSAAGNAESLQIMYGVGGERRLTEIELDLEGYRGSKPVRVGNAASKQMQLDAFGELLDLTWQWNQRGSSPDDDYWWFLLTLVERTIKLWPEPDRGIWEVRGDPQHFVHSQAMCWVALDRGIKLAENCLRMAPLERWKKVRDEMRATIEKKGYDEKRGVFVRSFESPAMDASLLLLPAFEFVSYDDERMVRTTDAIREELDHHGLLLRYREPDGLEGDEGVFVACTFWLAECLAHQGRTTEAREVFDRALSTGNDLGLFSEEFDPTTETMLGNYPQGLTHLSHIAAAVALSATTPSAPLTT
jgi:GH15 family glucan-1,4-alpha-glucosidase